MQFKTYTGAEEIVTLYLLVLAKENKYLALNLVSSATPRIHPYVTTYCYHIFFSYGADSHGSYLPVKEKVGVTF